ncbi:MAG TPA: RDD family protein [Opitutaceae bacterium]|jgi:uncharacterized RDD family membrane protein YckC
MSDSAVPPLNPDTEVCAVNGRRYPRSEMLNYEGKWIAAENKDVFFQRLREGVPADRPNFQYGGFWIRSVAWFIDFVLLFVVSTVVGLLLAELMLRDVVFAIRPPAPGEIAASSYWMFVAVRFLINTAISLTYFVALIRRYDATWGKMALGLKVLRPNGDKLGVGRIIGREFAKALSAMIIFLGFIMAGWDKEKRALHDYICDTRVVKK